MSCAIIFYGLEHRSHSCRFRPETSIARQAAIVEHKTRGLGFATSATSPLRTGGFANRAMTHSIQFLGGKANMADRFYRTKEICQNCEYFDGGGMGLDGIPINFHGDCHNSVSGRFQTDQDQTCKGFFPCSTRFPLTQGSRK